MKTVIIITAFLLVPCLVSSQNRFANTRFYNDTVGSPQATLENIQWLAGHWRGEGLGGTTEEVWTAPLGNSMMCAFKFLQNDEVKFYELVTITEENGTLIMRLKHFHANLIGWEEKDETVDFKLVKTTKDVIYFDGFTIEKVDNERMNIYVVIQDSEGKKEVKFEYHRSS